MITLVTFVSTLVTPIQYAVLLGVAIRLNVHVYNSAESTRFMQLVPLADGGWSEDSPSIQLSGKSIIVLQPVGSLFFAGVAEIENLLPEVGDARRAVVILRLRVYDEVGSTFLHLVENYHK